MPNSKPNTVPVHLFVSYAREDKEFMEILVGHLKPLEQNNKIKCWYDLLIDKGSDWKKQLFSSLKKADVFIVLVSRYSFNSEFIQQIEQAFALDLLKEDKLLFLPVLVHAMMWQETIYKHFQMIDYEGAPIAESTNQEKAWNSVGLDIRASLKKRFPHLWEEDKRKSRLKTESILMPIVTKDTQLQNETKSTIEEFDGKQVSLPSKDYISNIDDVLISEIEKILYEMSYDKPNTHPNQILTHSEVDSLLTALRNIEQEIRPLLEGKNVRQKLPNTLSNIQNSMKYFTETIRKCAHCHTSDYIIYADNIIENSTSIKKTLLGSVNVSGLTSLTWGVLCTQISTLHYNILRIIGELETLEKRSSRFSFN